MGTRGFPSGHGAVQPYVLLVLRAFPDAGAYCGPEEIQKYMREDFLADLEGAAMAVRSFSRPETVWSSRVNQQATGAGSGARVEMRYYQVWTFRGASVIRIESIPGAARKPCKPPAFRSR